MDKMVSVDEIGEEIDKEKGFDLGKESFKLASKETNELEEELKKIDDYYNGKYDSLDAERKERYKNYFESLTAERNNLKQMISESQTQEERTELIKAYLENSKKFDVLYASAEGKADQREIKLEQREEKDKKGRIAMTIASILVPIASSALVMWFGYHMRSLGTNQQLPQKFKTKN